MVINLKPYGDGRYVLEAYGFESMPFDKEDEALNILYFKYTINEPVQGTVQ